MCGKLGEESELLTFWTWMGPVVFGEAKEKTETLKLALPPVERCLARAFPTGSKPVLGRRGGGVARLTLAFLGQEPVVSVTSSC